MLHLLHAIRGHPAFLESSSDPMKVRGKQAPRQVGHLPPQHTSQVPNSFSHRDRKKKRFVGQSGQEDKKKIKTESGRYISSSYKRDLYPEGRGHGGGEQAPSASTSPIGGGGVREGRGLAPIVEGKRMGGVDRIQPSNPL